MDRSFEVQAQLTAICTRFSVSISRRQNASRSELVFTGRPEALSAVLEVLGEAAAAPSTPLGSPSPASQGRNS